MPNASYIEIAGKIKLIPLRAVEFINYDTDPQEFISIERLEGESSFNIDSISEPDDLGSFEDVGYQITSNIYVPHNVYKNNLILPVLSQLKSSGHGILFHFGNSTPVQGYTIPKTINSMDSMKFILSDKFGWTMNIEQVKYMPRMIIRISGYINYSTLPSLWS